jgi:phosphoglycerate dehydrogenase-like enzyme
MRIVFHGQNAAAFSHGFVALLEQSADLAILPDILAEPGDREHFRAAEVIIGNRFDATLPRPDSLRLFHLPAAGTDGVVFDALPPGAAVCNCFGHETAIAEYVMAALLARAVPLADADRRMRTGEWTYWAGSPERTHAEIAGSTLGLLGYGHIGQAVAVRAAAFGMQIHVANRGTVPESGAVARYFPLEALAEFWGSADAFVVTVPLTPGTRGLVDAAAFRAMRPDALLINVARGLVVDEQALFDALHEKRIGGAVIDTWYQYPAPGTLNGAPSALPFATLPNVIMTPHMSGWTGGTIRRRQAAMAANIGRLLRGESLQNRVHGS